MNPTRQYLTTEDVAERIGIPAETVRKWRACGTGPRYARFGRHVRYPIDEVERWEREQIDPEPAR